MTGCIRFQKKEKKSPIKPEKPKDEAADSQSVGFKFELVISAKWGFGVKPHPVDNYRIFAHM